jgi:phage terminase large subunit
MLFRGIDNPEKLKSIEGISRIWIEEASELDRDDFLELNRRARGKGKIQITLTFNPIIETHWIKQHFFDQKIDNVTIIKSTYKDNPYLDDEYRSQIEEIKLYDENQYRVYALAEWGKVQTGGEFYHNFSFVKHVDKVNLVPGEPIHISFDFNVVPYISMACFQIFIKENETEVRCFDEFALENPKNKTEALCREFLHEYERVLRLDGQNVGLFYYGDATGRSQDTAAKEHNYEIIKRVLKPYLNNRSERVPKYNPPIIARRDFINKIMAGMYPLVFKVSDRCVNMIKDLEHVREDADGKKLKQKTKNKNTGQTYEELGHMSDLLDYFFVEAFHHLFKRK